MAVGQVERFRVKIRTEIRVKFGNDRQIWTERKEVAVNGGMKYDQRFKRRDKIIAKYS